MNIADLGVIFNVIAPVAFCAAVGFAWSKRGMPYDTSLVTRLVSNIGLPCLVFATLSRVDLDIDDFLKMSGAAFVSTVSLIFAAWLICKACGWSARTYMNPIAFANTGNIGLPICLFAFGEAGLALAIAYFVLNLLMMISVGIPVASAKFDAKSLLRQPFLHASVLAVVVLFADVKVPVFIIETTQLLGQFTIPLMLITLGISLAELRVRNVARSGLIAALRMGLGVGVGVATAWIFGLQEVEAGVVILMCSMPVAVINYLLAEAHGADGTAVAGAVVVSTLVSFAALPLLLWWLV